jgi:hypothetical protein
MRTEFGLGEQGGGEQSDRADKENLFTHIKYTPAGLFLDAAETPVVRLAINKRYFDPKRASFRNLHDWGKIFGDFLRTENGHSKTDVN